MQPREMELLLRKIRRRRDEIRGYFTSNITPITEITYRETKAYERYEDAVAAKDFKPIKVGEHWGGGCNGWFKIRIDVPKEWKGKEVAAYFNFGGESCAFIDGKPYQGIDHNHEEVLLLKSARGGEAIDLVVDAASSEPWNPDQTRKVQFARADIGTRNMEVREYWYSLEFLRLLGERLPADSARRAKIVYLLNKSVDAFDYTDTGEASLKKSALTANKIVQPLLDCKANASALNIAAIGHSHLDVGYRWPYRETIRKCSRTFSTVMRMMEQYPEYLFTQSQVQLYLYAKQHYPALYEDIKKRVKDGRWEPTGSMWVEADCNLTSGESLVRQVVMGKNFFKDEFGVETDVLWLPDVFGYSAALPQILQKARVPYFMTTKISWNQFNKFPYNTFYWKGIDGSSVLSHFPPNGDYATLPEFDKLYQQVSLYAEKDRCDWSLMPYGWGDGGGGAENGHLEFLRRARDLEGVPRCIQTKVSDFFETIKDCNDLPEWVGELYLEMHRGTLTTQGHIKRNNRKSELLYRDAELLSSIAETMGLPYPREEIQEQWKQILLNQFHDVIPGSCIRQVVEDTDEMYPKILAAGESIADSAMLKIVDGIDTSGEGDAIVVFNTLPWQRSGIASVAPPDKSKYSVLDQGGNEVTSQSGEGVVRFAADVPSMGYSTYRLIKKDPRAAKIDLKVSKRGMENRFYKIALDSKGIITSIIHKETGRRVLPEGQRANMIRLYEDKPFVYDAWELDFYYDDKFDDITQLDSIEVVEQGPLSAAIQMTRSFNKSKFKQKMIIYADNPRIDFETWVDWHEDNKCLKACFPADVNSTTARYEIQFGNVERPTHANTSWDVARFEVSGQKWADLSDPDFGLSLMNDCKYGHHTKMNEMRLTLLRAPKEPDQQADMGEHIFTYSIMPHAGDYTEAQTVRQAYALNVPMKAIVTKASKGDLPAEKSFFAVDADNVILETVKKAEKGEGTILRFYECHGTRDSASVKVDLPFKKVIEVDLMEDKIADVASKNGEFSFGIQPFEIKTFRLL